MNDTGLVAIVGGEMTHDAYLERDGGYIVNDGPERMYRDAARLGVSHFVVPGTRPVQIAFYKEFIGGMVEAPQFLFPGVGKGQGGDIVEAFRQVSPYPAYAIVGRSIYASDDARGAAEELWIAVSDALGGNRT